MIIKTNLKSTHFALHVRPVQAVADAVEVHADGLLDRVAVQPVGQGDAPEVVLVEVHRPDLGLGREDQPCHAGLGFAGPVPGQPVAFRTQAVETVVNIIANLKNPILTFQKSRLLCKIDLLENKLSRTTWRTRRCLRTWLCCSCRFALSVDRYNGLRLRERWVGGILDIYIGTSFSFSLREHRKSDCNLCPRLRLWDNHCGHRRVDPTGCR